jgi:hypothetical protein
MGFVGIFRDYPLQTQTSKQHIREILRYEIIPYDPLKYPKSKQGLILLSMYGRVDNGLVPTSDLNNLWFPNQ